MVTCWINLNVIGDWSGALCFIYPPRSPGRYHTVVSPHLPCVKTVHARDMLENVCRCSWLMHINIKWERLWQRKRKLEFFLGRRRKIKMDEKNLKERRQMSTPEFCLCGLSISSPRTLGSQLPMLIDIPIKEISRFREEERAREQRNYCR